jgi:hypothetical protein
VVFVDITAKNVTWRIYILISKTTTLSDEAISVIKYYCNTFEKFSYNNPIYAKVSFHVLLGQLIRETKIPKGATEIDSRISLFLLQASGSGKTTAFRFIDKIGKDLGLNVVTLDEVSDPALIGTIEASTEFGQSDYGVTQGILSDADIVHYDEASALARRREYTKSTLSYFQTALNPIGDPSNVIYKKLAHGPPIQVSPHCSFLLTSYIPPGITKFIVETGFFQRICTIPRRLTREERKINSMRDIDLVGIKIETDVDTKELVKELLDVQKFAKSISVFEFPDRVRPLLRNKVKQYYKAIEAPNQKVSDLLDTFVPRYQDHLYRLSVHSAAMNFREEIKPADISYGFELIFPIFKYLLSWLESDTELTASDNREKKFLKIMFKHYRQMPKTNDSFWISSTQFVKELVPMMNVSRPTVYKFINLFIEQGWIKIKKDGRKTWYCIPKAMKKEDRKKI